MKVLHVIPSVAFERGGASRAVIEMVEALQNHGIDVEIVTTNDCVDTTLDVPTGHLIEYEQVKIRFFQRWSPKVSFLREFALSTQLTTWLWNNIKKFDLLHIHGMFSYSSTSAMLIARVIGIPYIVATHGVLCQWALKQSAMKKAIYLKLIERSNLNASAGLHLNSYKERNELDDLKMRCSNFVIPHGLNFSQVIPNANWHLRNYYDLPVDEPIILFLARIHPVKGLDYLIQALARLKDKRFTFILAGDGDELYKSQIQQYLKEHCLHDRTIITGFVEGELKQQLLQGSDLFVLTSYMENFGVAVLEALAAGTPALVTQGVALASEVEKNELGYVVPQEVNAIADALLKHLQLSEQQKKLLCERSKRFALESYTWSKVTASLIRTYKKVLEQDFTRKCSPNHFSNSS